MLKSGNHNKLSASFNSMVGSFTYSIFFLIYFLLSYWVFGTQVIDEIWLIVFGARHLILIMEFRGPNDVWDLRLFGCLILSKIFIISNCK